MASLTIGIKVEKAVSPHAWGGLSVEGVGVAKGPVTHCTLKDHKKSSP